jgi:hypothetical protein
METDATGIGGASVNPDAESRKTARRVEYFWLCRDCAAEMTLVFKKGAGITTQSLAPARRAVS